MNLTVPIHLHASRYPKKTAVVSGGDSLTFARLDGLLWRAARFLRGEGLRAGNHVAIAYTDPMLHLLVALALTRIGVGYYAVAPNEGPIIVDEVMRRIGARALIAPGPVEGIAAPRIEGTPARLFGSQSAPAGDFAEGAALVWRFVKSSGTTGQAKLFAATHRGMAGLMARFGAAVPTACGDVAMAMSDLSFFSPTRRVFRDLCNGATVVLPGLATFADTAAMVERHGISRIHAGPWTWKRFLTDPGFDASLRKLSVIETGGSIVDAQLRRAILERYTSGLTIVYGANELHPISTAFGQHCLSAPDTIGWPVPRGEIQIVDAGGTPLGPGQAGEIRVRDPDMIDRYWDDDDATARAFRDGWFYPGDVAQWSERGELLFKGRADDMIIYDGINIFPAEIENCLMEHPSVREAAAFGVRHPIHGALPWAAVLVSDDVTPTALQDFALERIGVRHPRRLAIMTEFPRTARGKALKREIARIMEAAANG